MDDPITEDDYYQWKHHIVTQKLFKLFDQIRADIDSYVVSEERILGDKAEIKGAYAIGKKSMLDTIQNIQFSEFIDEEAEDETGRERSS